MTVVGQTKCEDTSNANWASNQPTETDGYKVHMKKSDDYKWYTAEDEFKITPVCYDPNGGEYNIGISSKLLGSEFFSRICQKVLGAKNGDYHSKGHDKLWGMGLDRKT